MIQLAIVGAYLLVLLGVGVAANRLFSGTSRDYVLASQSIGPVLLLMSLFGTTMTAFALVGSTGKAFTLGIGTYGLMASWAAVVHPMMFLLIGVRIWHLGRRHGYVTQVQFFRDRFRSEALGWLAQAMSGITVTLQTELQPLRREVGQLRTDRDALDAEVRSLEEGRASSPSSTWRGPGFLLSEPSFWSAPS